MSSPFNDQWALLGTHWAGRGRRGRASRDAEARNPTAPGHPFSGERATPVPERHGARRHKRPRWIDRDT
jgi:hypothetical protein